MFLPLYQTLPGVSGSLGEVKDPLLGTCSTALESRPVFGCRILIRNVLPLPDFCISHSIYFSSGQGEGAAFHTGHSPHTLGVHYWAMKRLSPLFCPFLGLPCELPVGDHGEECELPGSMPACIHIC